jgi:hypothetical protein
MLRRPKHLKIEVVAPKEEQEAFFVTTRNQKTETHNWIILVSVLYAILRYYVIRRRFLSQKIPTELRVPSKLKHSVCYVRRPKHSNTVNTSTLCYVYCTQCCTNPGCQVAVVKKFCMVEPYIFAS